MSPSEPPVSSRYASSDRVSARRIRGLAKDLEARLDGDVRLDPTSRKTYSTASGAYAIEPLGAVSPRHEEDCRRVLECLREREIPIIARGAGTGMGGHNVGSGVLLDFTTHMDAGLEPQPDRGLVRVQPGIVRDALNERLAASGRFFAPDPSSTARCTVGGMAANNAGGLRTVRYGSTKHHVEGLRAVLPDGTALALGRETTQPADPRFDRIREAIEAASDAIRAEPPGPEKHASGYDVWGLLERFDPTRLFVGSEGTLGLLTELTLRTEPVPPSRATLLAAFRSLEGMGEAVRLARTEGASVIELMDRTLLDAVRAVDLHFEVDVPEDAEALLLIEVVGNDSDESATKLDAMRAALSDPALDPCLLQTATDADEQDRLWSVRKSSSPIIARRTDDKKTLQIVEDGGVEPERVVDYVRGIRRIFADAGIEVIQFGHASSGNIHVNPLFDVTRRDFPQQVRRVADAVTELIIGLGGTLTAEHGDGRVRAPYLARRFPRLVSLFETIKKTLDPENLMNPGVILPLPGQQVEHHLRYPEAR